MDYAKIIGDVYEVYNDTYRFEKFINDENCSRRKELVNAYRQENINILFERFKYLKRDETLNPLLRSYTLYLILIDAATKANNTYAVNELREYYSQKLIIDIIELYVVYNGGFNFGDRKLLDFIMNNKNFRNNLLLDIKMAIKDRGLFNFINPRNKYVDIFDMFTEDDEHFIKDLIEVCGNKGKKEIANHFIKC